MGRPRAQPMAMAAKAAAKTNRLIKNVSIEASSGQVLRVEAGTRERCDEKDARYGT